MILDATFLIDLLAGDAGAAAKLAEIDNRPVSVPTLAYTEVAVGIDPETDDGRTFESVMDRLPLIAYEAAAARRAVDIQRQLIDRGERIGAVDAMIAGIAVARDEPIVTRNASEFARTPARVAPY